MTPFTVYDSDGRILRSGCCPEAYVAPQAGPGEFATPFESNDATDYVLYGVVRARPSMATSIPSSAIADGTTPVILNDVPAGAMVTIVGPACMSGTVDTMTDVKLTFAVPGEYSVVIECFPYITIEGVVRAV